MSIASSFDSGVADALTDIAYQAVLRQGLLQQGRKQSFLDVELELWHSIRSALQHGPVFEDAEAVLVA